MRAEVDADATNGHLVVSHADLPGGRKFDG